MHRAQTIVHFVAPLQLKAELSCTVGAPSTSTPTKLSIITIRLPLGLTTRVLNPLPRTLQRKEKEEEEEFVGLGKCVPEKPPTPHSPLGTGNHQDCCMREQ